jgi:shikimate kinase
VIFGAPGSGKSSIAQRVGNILDLPHYDSDSLIEANTGKKISEIFLEDGESVFREMEAKLTLELLEKDVGVISLGGGAVIDPQVRMALENSGAVLVYLRINADTAAKRVGFNQARPLLLINPRKQWQELMEKRTPIYESINALVFDNNGDNATEAANNLILELERLP